MKDKEIKIGIVEPGIRHASADEPKSIEEKFCMVQERGAFDYIDVTPLPEHVAEFARCSAKYNLPILAGSCNYILGLEEQKLEQNLRIGAELGSIRHNTQVFMDHAQGHLISNDEVMSIYLSAYELGEQLGCLPTFEVHVNMWSEKFMRVMEVANMVRERGAPFRITLDHSHVIFKGKENQVEQAVFGVDKLIESGELIIDPFDAGNVFDLWLDQGLVAHAHARSVSPNNPKNVWAAHPDITNLRSSLHPQNVVGRGIQYPFIQPGEGQWHSVWQESDLQAWKEVVIKLLTHHHRSPNSELQTISTEFIPFTDYGEGSTYSLLENNAACAVWIKELWKQISTTDGEHCLAASAV